MQTCFNIIILTREPEVNTYLNSITINIFIYSRLTKGISFQRPNYLATTITRHPGSAKMICMIIDNTAIRFNLGKRCAYITRRINILPDYLACAIILNKLPISRYTGLRR